PYHAITSWIARWFAFSVPTQISVSASTKLRNSQGEEKSQAEESPSGLAQGFSLSEQATFIENGLRAMGLTGNFGRLIVLCGHGSQTDNNPYFGALDCGACGGNPGDANARVFAAMANHIDVRRILKEKGLNIPDDTWFLPAKHNTTTDRVTFYDVKEFPLGHEEDLRLLIYDLEKAGAQQALERCRRIPRAPTAISPEQAFAHVEERSMDWASSRPEWGLAGNAAFLIGRRSLTKGLDLGGRVFLHSYDPIADPEGGILEKIMTAPLIVGEWINTGYYFSGADPWNYGSGSKVIHNVVGGVGVMLGSQSDLQMGFPLQTVNNGEIHFHEPMRLLAIIEAKMTVISSIIQKHEILQQLFHNGWLNLVALDPTTFECHRYDLDGTWVPMFQ
ncbi:MAG: putative inorganic carbon transporter subunit DabA, partial [Nitrospirota bacterium]